MERAAVIRPHFPAGRRIIAVSDIHGNLPFFLGLMEKISERLFSAVQTMTK